MKAAQAALRDWYTHGHNRANAIIPQMQIDSQTMVWPCDSALCVGRLSVWARPCTLGSAGNCYGTVTRRSEATLRDWFSTRGRASGGRLGEKPQR